MSFKLVLRRFQRDRRGVVSIEFGILASVLVGILFGAVLFGALASAGTTIQLFSDIPLDLVNIIEGTVMIFAVVEIGRLRLRRRRRAA